MSEAVNQIKIGAALDGTFDTTIQSGKRKMGELGAAAREAGKGTGAIGDGMAGSAQKVEAATKNMVGSIQRQIAALEAGDKSSRQYQESLARMRGIDTAALKPYLDQLDAAKLKQSEAAKSAESLAGSMGSIRIAAVAIGASLGALAMFSKNIIDAADGLNDLSQRVGISVRELGKYQLAAEQSGASLESISKGVKGLAKSMVENGDALRKAGIDATSADGAMQQLADVFSEMPDGIEKTTLATKLFGKAGMDLIPMLNLGSEGLREAALASAEYAEQMAIMAPLADSLNDKMAVVALSSKTAGAIMVNEFLPSLDKIAQAFVDSKDGANSFAGVLGSVVNSTVQVAALLISDVVFVLKATGREIGAIAAQAVALASLDFKGFSAISDAVKDDAARARVELDKFQNNLVNGTVNIQAAYNKRQGTGEVLKDGARGSNLLRSLGGDGEAKKALAEANRELEEQNRLIAESAGLTASFAKDWDMLSKMFLLGKLSLDQLTEAQAKLLAKQPAIKASIDAQKRAIEESSKMYSSAAIAARKYYEELANNSDKLEATNKKLAEENELIGLSEKAKEGLVLSRLDNAIAIEKEAFALLNLQNSSEIEIATAQRRILLMQERRNLTGNGYVAKEASAAADAWRKAAESIRDNLTDAFMQAIDGTKSLWVALRDSVVGMFKNMVLRPIIQGVLQPVATALTGSLIGNAANAATGQAATGGLIGSMLPPSSMGSLDIAGFTLPQIGMGIAALGILKSLGAFGSNFISATDSGRARVDYNAAGVGGSAYSTTGDAAQIAAATKNTNTLAKSYYDTAKSLGITAMQAAFEVGTNTGREGAAPQTVLGVNIGKVGYSSGEIASTDAAGLQLAASRAVLTALQASELPSYLSGVFDDITASTATQEQITTALTSAGALKTFHDQLLAMPFKRVADLSYEATQGLIAASGGLDKLASNLGDYYSNFYTAEEQRAQTIANINKATAGSGLDASTATRESFRALVEAQDLTAESGRSMYAALIGVAGAFSSVAPTAKEAADALEKTAKAAKDAAATIYSAQSSQYSNLLSAQQAQSDYAEQAAQASQQAAQESAQAAQQAAQAITQAFAQAGQGIADFIKTLLGEIANPATLQNSYLSDLAGAKNGDLQASQRLPASAKAYLDSQISNSATSSDANIARARMAAELSRLPAVKTYEQQSLDALTAIGSGVSSTVAAVQDLNGKLIVDLNVKAQSELLKILKFTADTAGLSPEVQALALMTVSTLDKTIALAVKQQDPYALAVALAQGGTVNTLFTISGGDLTPEQLALINGIEKYNKNVLIGVHIDATELTALQKQLMTTFGTIDLNALGGAGVDITSAVNQGALSRLNSISTYIRTLDWSDAGKGASAWATYDAARAYGVTQADIANAMGLKYTDIQALFDTYNIPRFAAGSNYLPDDMLAQVHQGERIIPAADNRELMQRLQNPKENSAALVTEIKALREENRAQASAMVQMQQRLTKLMERWDGSGMPETRVTA